MCYVWAPYTWWVIGATDPVYKFYILGFIFCIFGNNLSVLQTTNWSDDNVIMVDNKKRLLLKK